MRHLLILTLLLAACGEVEPPTPEPAEPCEPGPTDEFALGIMIFDSPRWFQKFDEGCRKIEMETGLQGGWHVEPAIQAPQSAVRSTLGGNLYWTVDDAAGNQVADGTFELFRSFWQTLEGGEAYWGDFVIFDRNPGGLVGSEITINCTLDFDEESGLEDVMLSETVTFVDEDPTTVFQ